MPVPFAVGQTIREYKLLTSIGRGGMGQVFLANDLRLGRRIALKTLSEDSAADPAVVKRFRQEARAAAALNHPSVAQVYSVEEEAGQPFITMEYVEGPSLREMILLGGMELAEFFRLAIPLLDGFRAAHERGVIHRDIKPENIIVTGDRGPKILDFGLARLTGANTPDSPLTTAITAEGIIVGTVAYISPEQVESRVADARSDVWSLGVLFYEMLTGLRPFRGDSAMAVLSAILKDDPLPIDQVRTDVPESLRGVVARCLKKSPTERFPDAGALLTAVDEARRGSAPINAARRRGRVLTAVSLLLLGFGALWMLWDRPWPLTAWRQAPPPFDNARLTRLTTLPGLEDQPAWAPDGRSLLLVTDEAGRLGIRSLDLATNQLRAFGNPKVDEVQPVFSPDGARVAFVSSRDRGGRLGIFMGFRAIELYVYGQNGDLFVMSARGTEARKVFENAYDPDWAPDGETLACRSIRDGTWRIWVVPLDGKPPRPIQGAMPDQRMLHPTWSPDGRWIAYVGSESAASGWDLFAAPVEGGRTIQLTQDRATVALEPVWTPDGRWIVFSSNRHGAVNLWNVAFDPGSPGRREPRRVTTGIGEDLNPSISRDGKSLAYSTLRTSPDIWTFTEADRSVRRLTSETTVEDYPRLSPDGTRLLFYSDRSGREEVWSMQLETGRLEQVSDDGGTQNAWSPNGAFIAYGTKRGLVLVEVATGRRTRIAEDMVVEYPDFSPDSRRVAFQGHSGRGHRLYVALVPKGVAEEIPTPQGVPGNPSWSPDGRTLFFQLDQLGYRNVWALDLERGLPRQLTSGNIDDAHPDVSPDGKRVLFLRHHRDLFTVPVGGGEPTLLYSLGGSTSLIEWPAWTAAGDGVVFSVSERTGDIFRLDAGDGMAGGGR